MDKGAFSEEMSEVPERFSTLGLDDTLVRKQMTVWGRG